MRFDLDISQHWLDWPGILSRARYAEANGFQGAWVFDHFKPNYADPATGEWNGPCLEGWSLLAGLAAATDRIRLGVEVTGVTYRHPSVLATQAVTVDHISGGRLDIGMGAAWHQQEHRELGIPFFTRGERIERLEEALEVITRLLTEDEARFGGRYYTLDRATYLPRPVQRPHPPIMVGAGGERRTIPIAARHADIWHTFGSVDGLRRKSRVLEEHAKRAGRDPAKIVRATDLSISEPWDEVRERIDALRGIGFSHLVVNWPSEGQERLEEFVGSVMPDLID